MRVGCSGVTTKRGWRRQSRRIIITTCVLHMRVLTRRRELNDDCCDILLSYYVNGCAAIRAVA
jgi:hypothetical protein